MKPNKGDLITLEDDTKYIVVETMVEGDQTFHCLVSEDEEIVVFVVEKMDENGLCSVLPITDETEKEKLTYKFDELINN